jgi:hypothetical protein
LLKYDSIIRDFGNNVKGEERLGAEAQAETKQFTQRGKWNS